MLDPSGNMSFISTIQTVALRLILRTIWFAATPTGVLINAATATAFRFPVAFFMQMVIPPLVKELNILSGHLRSLSPTLSKKISELANSLDWAATKSMFFFTLAPLTGQLPIAHVTITLYQALDFLGSIARVENALLSGAFACIGLSLFGVDIRANISARFVPHSRLKIGKGLVKGDLVPADDVRVATQLILALKNMDYSSAKGKWEGLKERVKKYGKIQGEGELVIQW